MNQKIRFKGNIYFLVEAGFYGSALAYSHQCDERGELICGLFDDSFAHLFKDGRIIRYGETIGTKFDIEYLDIQSKAN